MICLDSHGASDGFVAKYSLSGEFLWYRQWGPGDNDVVYDVATLDGDVYVAGYQSIPVGGKSFRKDALIAKLDGDGNVQWTKTVENGTAQHIAAYKTAETSASIVVGAPPSPVSLARMTDTGVSTDPAIVPITNPFESSPVGIYEIAIALEGGTVPRVTPWPTATGQRVVLTVAASWSNWMRTTRLSGGEQVLGRTIGGQRQRGLRRGRLQRLGRF